MSFGKIICVFISAYRWQQVFAVLLFAYIIKALKYVMYTVRYNKLTLLKNKNIFTIALTRNLQQIADKLR